MTTANTLDQAIALQATLNKQDKALKAAKGKRNDVEYTQYCLLITYGNENKVKLRTKAATRVKDALVEAGRSERNAQTVVSIVFNAKVKKATAGESKIESIIATLAERELETVSKLKRFIAGDVDKLKALADRITGMDQDEQDKLKALLGWDE